MGIASAIGTALAVGLAVNFFDKKSDNDVMSAEAQGICSQIDPETVKIVVFIPLVPSSHGEDPYIFVKLVRDAMGKAGAGTIGKYKECSFSIEGTSHFIQPNGKIIELREVRLEMVCPASISEKVIQAGLEVHPWETPGVEVFPLLKRELKEPKGI